MAVYSKKDYENFINREKIKKQKIKKRILNCSFIIMFIALIAFFVFLFMGNKNNFMKTDNYTDAMNYAIQMFATETPKSHNDHPRLTYNYMQLPPTHSQNPVEDDEIDDSNEFDDKVNTDNKTETNNNNTNTNKETNKQDTGKEEKKRYEYDYFVEVAGKGNYPGYSIVGPNFIKDIRKEVIIAIKAYTTLPLPTGSSQDDYRLGYKDDKYDYIYFFLTGEVRKVEKSYLKTLDEKYETGKKSYDIYNFWISLTEDKSSKIASELLTSETGNNYTVVVSNLKNEILGNTKVSFISGSYIESETVEKASVIIFRDVPFGTAEVRVEKEGFIDFPHEVAYKEYEQINIANNQEYKGHYISSPLRVKLLASSAAKCTFSHTTMSYEYGVGGNKMVTNPINGNFNVKLTNKKEKTTIEKTVEYNNEYFYWFEFFPEMESGIYDIEITPTNVNYSILKLKDLYINEHGIGEGEYLTKNADYNFAFCTDEKVNVQFNIKDETSYGLHALRNNLDMYHLIKTKALQNDKQITIKFVNTKNEKTTEMPVTIEGEQIVSDFYIKQDTTYDIYFATVFGDILLYKDFRVKTNNYIFDVSIKDDMLPQCIADITIFKSNCSKISIINSTQPELSYTLSLVDGTNEKYIYKTNEAMSSGYYFLNMYDKNDVLLETYLILISNKSNNYEINFK